jgi:ankyrin repeat protein
VLTQVLLEHGANASIETKGGETALHIVSRGEYDSQEQGVGTARLLLERGVDVNARRKDSWTSLHWAAFKGRVELTQLLLDQGANAKVETERGETALHIVSRGEYDSQEQSISTARLLLEHGVDVNAQQKDGWTSLHCAAFKGRVVLTQLLLEHGANASIETKGGETALHIVSRGEYDSQEQGVSTARLLLECGVDVNARRKDSWTSLHWAAFKGRVEVAQVLLDHGANATLETERRNALHIVSRGEYDSQEQGALHIVSQGEYDSEGHGIGIARLLLERGLDVNAREKDGWTSLHCAAFKGRVEVAQFLLDHGANAMLETDEGKSALHMVSRGKYGSEEHGIGIARLLLGRGLDVNAQEKDGWTSLHCAAFKGRVEVAQFLLDHGANATLETKEGETALHLVSQGEYDSEEHGIGIARLLLDRGVDVHVQNQYFATALHCAAFDGRFSIVQLLLDRGANPNAESDLGRTPLHFVSRGKYKSQEHGVGIVRLLLERGVDVSARGKDKGTPLHWAAFYGKLEVVQVRLFFSKQKSHSYSGTIGVARPHCKRKCGER